MLNQLNYVRSYSMLTCYSKIFSPLLPYKITSGNKHNENNIFCQAGKKVFPGENCHKLA